jgi:hypothetical protein
VCHFSLYRGVHPRVSVFFYRATSHLVPSKQDLIVAQRSPTLLRPNLDVLAATSANDLSAKRELAIFGFICTTSSTPLEHSNSATMTCDDPFFKVGQLTIPIKKDRVASSKLTSMGSNFPCLLYHNLPVQTLEILEDQRQAGYSEEEIMDALNLPIIPPKDLVFEFIGRCYRVDFKITSELIVLVFVLTAVNWVSNVIAALPLGQMFSVLNA